MSKSILQEAQDVISDRRARVDGPEGNFARIAKVWSVVFGHDVTPRDVALCMIGLKFARECYTHWHDNIVDLAGYADCLALIEGDYETTDSPAQDQTAEATEWRDGEAKDTIKKLKEWIRGLKPREPILPPVINPAPWEGGLYGPSPCQPSCCTQTACGHSSGNVVTFNAKSNGGCGQADALCACGKVERDCDWPTCAEHKVPVFKAWGTHDSGP